MSRVEPIERQEERKSDRGRQQEERRQEPGVGHTPGQAEGEERDVDDALRERG